MVNNSTTSRPYSIPAAVSILAAASLIIYALSFTIPMWLPTYYAVPHLDTPKILGVSRGSLDSFTLTIGLLFLLYLAAVRATIGLQSRRAAIGVLALGLLLGLALVPMYPGGAADIYAYIAEADAVLRYHANPFTTPIAALPQSPLLPYLDYAHETTHYGPLWLVIGTMLRAVAGTSLLTSLLLFKAAALGFLLATAWLVYLVLRRRQPNLAVAGTLMVAWNPQLLFELAGNGHNDVAMAFFIVLAFYLRERGSHRLSITSLLAATLVKYTAIVLLPLFLVAMLRGAGHPRRWLPAAIAYATGAALAGGAILAVVGLRGTVGVMSNQSSEWFTTSLQTVAYLRLSRTVAHAEAADIVTLAGRWLFSLALLLEVRRVWRRPEFLPESSFRAMLALLLLVVSWFQPWYIIWVVPLGVLAGTRVALVGALALSLGGFLVHTIMGFAWRLDWNRGSLITINAAGAAVVWIPTLVAVVYARIRRFGELTPSPH